MSVFRYINNTSTSVTDGTNTVPAWGGITSNSRLAGLDQYVNLTLQLLVDGVEENNFVEKVLGSNTLVDKNGTVIPLAGGNYILPTATSTVLGGIKTSRRYPDGTLATGPIYANSSLFILGHSFAYYQNLTSAGVDISATSGGVSSRSSVEWCNSYLRTGGGIGFDVIGNSGIGSMTLEQIISGQRATALASGAANFWVNAGVNNFNYTLANPDTIPAIMAQWKLLLDPLSATATGVVVVENITPVNGSSSQARSMQFRSHNIALKRLCSSYTNVVYIDSHSVLLDLTSATLAPLTSMMQTDGTHMTGLGAWTVGRNAAEILADKIILIPYYTETVIPLPSPVVGTSGTFTNTSTTGSFTGSIPTGWTLESVSGQNATTCNIAGSQGPDNFQAAVTATTASVVKLYNTDGVSIAALLNRLTDKAVVECGISHQGTFGNRFELALLIDGYRWYAIKQASDEGTPVWPNKQLSGKFRSKALSLSSLATAASVQLEITIYCAAGQFYKINMYEPSILKVA